MAFPFLRVLSWVRRVLGILPFPEWVDVEAVRRWVVKVLDLLDELADETASQVDDKVVAALRRIVEDVETWNMFYALIVDLVGEGKSGMEVLAKDGRVNEVANKAGIDLSVFQFLLDTILEFIEWFKNRVDIIFEKE